MYLSQLIENRKSIRAFTSSPVSRETIADILELAIKAPSAINLQPWDFIIVSGKEKERLSRRLLKAYKEKQISCGPGSVKPLPALYNLRGVSTANIMKPFLDKLHVTFNSFINEGSCNFYGAPVAILFCMDNCFPRGRLVDVGIAIGYFILIAHEHGLATCPIGLINAYEDEIKELLNIPDNKDVVIGMALGYSDNANPINEFKSPRDSLDMFVRWVD